MICPPHHWLCSSPTGGAALQVPAFCKTCGAQKVFQGMTDTDFDYRLSYQRNTAVSVRRASVEDFVDRELTKHDHWSDPFTGEEEKRWRNRDGRT